MKLDAMTIGAIGFAAFAAYTTLKKPKTGQASASTGADVAFGQATAQRREVGAALWQNNIGWLNLTPSQLAAYGSYTDELKAQNIL